eukprot:c7926_g1_i1 orf=85-1044(+)
MPLISVCPTLLPLPSHLHLRPAASLLPKTLAVPRICCFQEAYSVPSSRKKMDPSGCSAAAAGESAVAAASDQAGTARSRPQTSRKYGETHVIEARGKHEATVVWLHGLGDTGSGWVQILETLPCQNIKWILPTAPVQPVRVFGGMPCTAWFDVGLLSDDAPDDLVGMDSSTAHVAEIISSEPPNIKLAIGGFSQGAATALYTMICAVSGKYSNGIRFPFTLSAAVALSGWFPCARDLKRLIDGNDQTLRRMEKFPLLLCHGTVDDVVQYAYGEKSAAVLTSAGFKKLIFNKYKGLGHYSQPDEMNDVCTFLKSTLDLGA